MPKGVVWVELQKRHHHQGQEMTVFFYQARRTKLGATALVVNTHVIVDQLIRLKVGGVKHFKLGGF